MPPRLTNSGVPLTSDEKQAIRDDLGITQIIGAIEEGLSDKLDIDGSNLDSIDDIKSLNDKLGDVIYASNYGAVGDARRTDSVSITAGNYILTSSSGVFTDYYVGKYIRVENAGSAGSDLITTIESYQSATQVTLAEPASTTVLSASGRSAFFGTDDTEAIQDAINSGLHVILSSGCFLANVRVRRHGNLEGQHRANIMHGLMTPSQLLDRIMSPTVMMPAVASLPVIYGDSSNNAVFGTIIRGIAVSGSAKKAGYGIKLGEDYGVGGGLFGNIRTVIDHCNTDGFNIGITSSNAADGEISHCWSDDCNIGYQIYRHDGILIRNSSATNTITTFKIGGSKNVFIANGNFNYMTTLVEMEASQLSVGTINVEDLTGSCFVVKHEGDASFLSVDYVKGLRAATGVLVRNEVPESVKHQQSVRINSSFGFTYYDTANTQNPVWLGGLDRIRFYKDNTFAILNRTEKVRRVYASPHDLERAGVIKEEFVSRLVNSPYCDLGWTVTNISGTTVFSGRPYPYEPGGVRIASSNTDSTNVSRFTVPGLQFRPPDQTYWRMRWRFLLENQSTAVWRIGIYSLDSAVKPQNGLGIRVDTTAGSPDSTVKLEVISGGASTVVDTLVPLSSIGQNSEVLIQRTTQGVSCVIMNMSGVPYAPEVILTSTLPSWSGYMSPMCYAGVSATSEYIYTLGCFEYIEYPNSNEWR